MSKFAKGDSAAAGMGINKIKDKTTDAVSDSFADESFSPHPTLPINSKTKFGDPMDEQFKAQFGMYPWQVGANDVFNKTMDMYDKDRHELNDHPLSENNSASSKTPEAAYKEVTGSGQSKRYKTFTADGTKIKEGRGSGPANLPEGDPNKGETVDAKFEGEDRQKTNAENYGLAKKTYADNYGLGKMKKEEEEPKVEPKYEAFFKRNILHDYDAVTYNFRLSMLSEADAISAQQHIFKANEGGPGFREWVPTQKKVIIAETGSTVLSINDVQINAVAGPVNNGKRLTGAVDFQMNIQQPLSASFTDVLVNAAISLGIPDGLKASYLLELKFIGRDPFDGKIVNPIPTTERQFLIEIIAVEANVSPMGASYNVRAVRSGDKGIRQKTYKTDRPLQLSNLKTISDLVNKTAEVMNLNELDKLAIEKGVLDEYYIVMDDDFAKQVGEDGIIDTAELEKPITSQNFDGEEDTQLKMFRIPQGTSIDRILEFGISHSKKLQKLAKGLKEGADPNSSDSGDIDKFTKHIFTLKVDVKNIAWDTIRNEYAKEYRYTISLYPTIRPEIAPGLWADQNKVAQEKIKDLISGDLSKGKSKPYKALSKRYDYLFTGLNDKVLRFDIKYNNQFFFALHSYRGVFSNLSKDTQSTISKSAETLARFKEQQKELRSAWSTYVKRKADYITLPQEAQETAIGGLWNKFTEEREKLISVYVEGVKDGTFEGDSNTAQSLQGVGADRFSATRQQLVEKQQANSDKIGTDTLMNATDIKDYAETIDRQEIVKTINENADSGFKVMWGAVPDDFRNNFNAEDGTPGKGHFDSVIEASLADFEADLVAMDMDIKGDPFWLESERDPLFSDSASYYEGENYLLFRAITSAGEPDPETGLANPNREGKEQMLNGVYAVVQINNSFSGGQFIQNIKGVKEAFITDISILEQYKEEKPYGNS